MTNMVIDQNKTKFVNLWVEWGQGTVLIWSWRVIFWERLISAEDDGGVWKFDDGPPRQSPSTSIRKKNSPGIFNWSSAPMILSAVRPRRNLFAHSHLLWNNFLRCQPDLRARIRFPKRLTKSKMCNRNILTCKLAASRRLPPRGPRPQCWTTSSTASSSFCMMITSPTVSPWKSPSP